VQIPEVHIPALFDLPVSWLGLGVLGFLTVAIIAGLIFRASSTNPKYLDACDLVIQSVVTWWLICALFCLTIFAGIHTSMIIFTLITFIALREYVILIPTPRADRRMCFWTFFLFTILQYFLLYIKWQGFMIVIPVYAFLVIPAVIAFSGDAEDFLDRASRIQWGLMICVYCLSSAPALLILNIPGYGDNNEKLLLFLLIVALLGDLLQDRLSKLGDHYIAKHMNKDMTWEGFMGGAACSAVIGAALWWMTPFSISAAMGMALAIGLMAITGRLVISAIKRDRDIAEYEEIIQVPNNMLDRVAPLMFAAPVFFHIVRFFYATKL